MLFIFKKKKITVDCFTHLSVLHDLFPPKKAVHFFPEWWKKVPSAYTSSDNHCHLDIDHPTIRKCSGLIDWYKTGYIIPLWSELFIRVSDDGYTSMFSNDGLPAPSEQGILMHSKLQYGNHFENFHHGKIVVPWIMNEKTGVKIQLSYPMWNHVEKWSHFHIVPGIINFKENHMPHVNAFFSRGDYALHFAAGEPLVYLSSISEKEIEFKTHLISSDEYQNMSHFNTYQISYKKRASNITKFLKENNKCPYGH